MTKFANIAVGDEVVLALGHGEPSARKVTVTKITAQYFDADNRRWSKNDGKEAGERSTSWSFTRVEPLNETTQKWLDRTETEELVYRLSTKLDKLPLTALRTIDRLVEGAEWLEQNPSPQDTPTATPLEDAGEGRAVTLHPAEGPGSRGEDDA